MRMGQSPLKMYSSFFDPFATLPLMKAFADRAAYLEQVRKVVIAHEGNVTASAASLGLSRVRLSVMLNHRGLVEWWRLYKAKRIEERRALREKRRYQQRKQRNRSAQDILYNPAPYSVD